MSLKLITALVFLGTYFVLSDCYGEEVDKTGENARSSKYCNSSVANELISCSEVVPTSTQMPSSTMTPTTLQPQRPCPDLRVDFNLATQFNFFGPKVGEDKFPSWQRSINKPIAEQSNNAAPSALILPQDVFGVDLEGTFSMTSGDDFVGVAFSFENAHTFYLLSWKGQDEVLNGTFLKGGIMLQLVNSRDGLDGRSDELSSVLQIRETVPGQATTLLEARIGWNANLNNNYNFKISHRPTTGDMRITIGQYGTNLPTFDSGCIRENTLKGGKFGVYAAFQAVKYNISFVCSDVPPCFIP